MIGNEKRDTWCDALKGMAICGVVMTHCGSEGLPDNWGKITNCGKYGVQLFFVLSAYLAFRSYKKYYEQNSGSKHEFRKGFLWTIQHILRILPLYYVALLVYSVMTGGNSYWLGNQEGISAGNMIAHLFFLHGLFPKYMNSILSVEWYLGTLVIFWWLVPFLYKAIKTIEMAFVWWMCCSVICRVLSLLILPRIPESPNAYLYQTYVNDWSLLAQLPILLLGVVVFFIVGLEQKKTINDKKGVSWGLIIVALIGFAGLVRGGTYIWGVSTYILYAIIYTIVIIALCIQSTPIIDNPIFRVLGKYSYAIYLVHHAVIYFMGYTTEQINTTGSIQWIIRYMLVLIISLSIGILLTIYYERPIVFRLKKLLSRVEGEGQNEKDGKST